ncbi:hypothetical protein WG66_015190, partial [Moniliophthora roreri]
LVGNEESTMKCKDSDPSSGRLELLSYQFLHPSSSRPGHIGSDRAAAHVGYTAWIVTGEVGADSLCKRPGGMVQACIAIKVARPVTVAEGEMVQVQPAE